MKVPASHPAYHGLLCDCGDHAFAPINAANVVIVSAADAHLLRRRWKASIGKDRYVTIQRTQRVNGGFVTLTLGRIILGLGLGEIADHRNGITSDNRRENLRPATTEQNSQNSRARRIKASKLKGVTVRRDRPSQYRATIRVKRKTIQLGSFRTEEAAHAAYVAAAEKYFGDYARPQ